MTEEEKECIRKANIDIAKKNTKYSFILIIISILTYLEPLINGNFDFGIIFEVVSLIFLLASRYYMTEYDEIRAKRYNNIALVTIIWLLIYDFIILLESLIDQINIFVLIYNYFWGEILTILYIIELFRINAFISRAYNPEKYKNSTDWFYAKK